METGDIAWNRTDCRKHTARSSRTIRRRRRLLCRHSPSDRTPDRIEPRTVALWFKLADADDNDTPEILGYGPNQDGRRFGLTVNFDRIGVEAYRHHAWGHWTRDANWHHLAAVVPQPCSERNLNQARIYLERGADRHHARA